MQQNIQFKTADGTMGGYLALPKNVPAPAVLVIQEIFGVNKVMRDLCDALAAEGYVAVCPDLFWRIEPGIDITDQSEAEWKQAFELFGKFDVDKGVEDLKVALADIRKHHACDGRVGTVGYCLGGKLAYLMAARSDTDCSVSYYGVQIDQLLGEAKNIRQPLLMHVAAKDQFVPPEAQAKMKAGLAGNPQVTMHVYEGQDHAFARVGGAHYDAAAAKLANDRTKAFFRQHLGQSEITKAHGSHNAGGKAHAVRFARTGGPEVLSWESVEVGQPGAGEVLIRHKAIGLNYIDTYHRSGLYPQPLPSGVGLEAAGVIEAVGAGVTHVKAGDRVAYGTGPIGAYSEARIMPAEKLVKLPAGIDDRQGAVMMLKGLIVQYLLRSSYRVKAGETVLVHAAAGGIGQIAGQWLKHLGVSAIGTVGSKEKAEIAKAHGYAHVINYREENVVEAVKRITKGEMLPVVYDGVGKDTWDMSLDCLRPHGFMISFGNASGAVPPVNIGILAQKGSLYVQRPTLMAYTRTAVELQAMAKELFEVVGSGAVKINVEQSYALKDAAQAHRDLEARKTVGQTVLLP